MGILISIHALLAESDGVAFLGCGRALAFLSTLSLRRATQEASRWTLLSRFLSTLSLRRATVAGCGQLASGQQFLSTLSLRRATTALCSRRRLFLYFYPRSPCGERRTLPRRSKTPLVISIHALLAESDQDIGDEFLPAKKFLSTLSLRRATM